MVAKQLNYLAWYKLIKTLLVVIFMIFVNSYTLSNKVFLAHLLFFSIIFVVLIHDDVIKWKHFPRYWPFVRGIHRSPINSPHKGQWRGALMFSLICAWINSWVNNRDAGDLRRHHAHYNVTGMSPYRLVAEYCCNSTWLYCYSVYFKCTFIELINLKR